MSEGKAENRAKSQTQGRGCPGVQATNPEPAVNNKCHPLRQPARYDGEQYTIASGSRQQTKKNKFCVCCLTMLSKATMILRRWQMK
jgi:hypothetical protein